MPKKLGVCCKKTCAQRGAEHILNELKKQYTNSDTTVEACDCTGFCEEGPNVVIDNDFIIHEATVPTIVEKIKKGEYKKINQPTFEEISKNDFLGDLF